MPNEHMKKCSTLSVIKEMQSKTTRREDITDIQIAITEKTDNNVGYH